jgi:phosphoglycerate dehydrogenase-like enzyme
VRAAFAGVFAAHVADRVRARLRIPCEVALVDDREIVARLGDVDVLVTMAFTREMAAAAPRLRLVQVPGAGLDRIDRTALGPGTALANAYGHDTGIAEYVLGAMLAMSRAFCRIDADLRRGQWDSVWSGAAVPLWSELAGKTLGILGYGRIGQEVARRALAFDMDVLAIRRDPSQPDPHRLAFVRGPARWTRCLPPAIGRHLAHPHRASSTRGGSAS